MFVNPENKIAQVEAHSMYDCIFRSMSWKIVFVMHIFTYVLFYKRTYPKNRFGRQRLQVYIPVLALLFFIFTYVLGVYSTRVPEEKVWWTETTSVFFAT